MQSYTTCVSNQTDYLLNELNVPQDFFGDKSNDEIYNEYSDSFSLRQCDFDQIVLEDIPQGTGLTFIAIARAVVYLPGSYVLAILFYSLITMLGIGTMIGTLEGVLTPVADLFANYKSLKSIPKSGIMFGLCIIHFAIGILFTTGAGTYWLDIFNNYSANINLLVLGLCQYIVVYWVFGAANWHNEMKWMIKSDNVPLKIFFWYLRVCSLVISPLLIIVILVFFVYDMAVSYRVALGI